jgi:gamma-glutamyltranspeptidase
LGTPAAYLHLVAEAKRIAFADRAAYLADPRRGAAGPLKMLISERLRGAAAQGDRSGRAPPPA